MSTFLEVVVGIAVVLVLLFSVAAGLFWAFDAIFDEDAMPPEHWTRGQKTAGSLVAWFVFAVLLTFVVTHVDFSGPDCGPGTHQADTGGTYVSSGNGAMTYVPNMQCVPD